ncbi:zona pellucida sperm-binding protein 3-like [Mustelus asterias]
MPRLTGSAILRSSKAIVRIECSYPRKDNGVCQVDWPTLAPYSSLLTGERFLLYSLRQMNDNWDTERASSLYYLGEFMHIEAAVVSLGPAPLRLYVDSCIATLTPDKGSTPRYPLIDYNGCLVDSKAGNSRSSLVFPRIHPDKLQIKLDAFRFPVGSISIFITCRLKVAETGGLPNPANKACFFQKPANVWTSVEGSNGICSCCNHGNCRGGRRWRRAAVSQSPGDHARAGGEIQMGPLEILAADAGRLTPSARTQGWNPSNGQGRPEQDGVDLRTMLILMGVVGAVALLLSGLLVGGAVICGALTIFNLYNRLARPSI